MTKIDLTLDLILATNSGLNDELCKSRFFSGSFINSLNGRRYDKRQSLSHLDASARLAVIQKESWKCVANNKIEDVKALNEALTSLDYLSNDSLDWLNAELKSWLFFNENLKTRAGEPVNCRHLHGRFDRIKTYTGKAFYQELCFWAAENQYKLTFKNRGVKRKVILEL